MPTPKQRLERTIIALCDEAEWGLRYWYAAKAIIETEQRLTPTLFDTFYWACLDQAALILSRMLVAKEKESINVQYLLNQVQAKPSLSRLGGEGELAEMVRKTQALFVKFEPLIKVLEEQRDRNLAHLDRKHVNDPEWHAGQEKLCIDYMEDMYQELAVILLSYHRLFLGVEPVIQDWEKISRAEVKDLIEFFNAYQAR